MTVIDLTSPLSAALGGRTAGRLTEKLGLASVGQLLRYYPRKYERRGRMTDLAALEVDQKVTVMASVVSVNERKLRPGAKVKSVTTVTISDSRTQVACAFFNRFGLSRQLPVGVVALFSGTVKMFNHQLQINSPQVTKLDDEESSIEGDIEKIESFAGGMVPIYPLVEGLTLKVLQNAVGHTLGLLDVVPDPLPDEIRSRREILDLDTALREIHRPSSDEALERAQQRLRYDEALTVQLVLARRREALKGLPAEPCPRIDGGVLSAFDAQLAFELTAGQRDVGEHISADLATIHPMNRLLQGEVGSGKTVVALRAMLQVVDSGRQAVLLAPTEVLAAQHARSLRAILGPLGQGGELGAPPDAVKITLLTGSLGAKQRRVALLDMMSGQAGIAVGTHALLSEDVYFAELGLVVIDEQHRFGVEQRNALRAKHPEGNPPHVLVMTATPIPRTVAMTVYGDLETSILEGLPADRSPISTTVVPAAERPDWLARAWARVREEVAAGHQVYVVCPKIGLDDKDPDGSPAGRRKPKSRGVSGAHADPDDEEFDWDPDGPDGAGEQRRPPLSVLQVAEELRDGPLRDLRLGVLHGKLASTEKDAVMVAFATGDLDVLVATTVIEVGVDVPNATAMIILDAERFGMSQLHQLRGRVGRGTAPGICLLVTEAPPGTPGLTRLTAVAATTDGFRLAEEDLRLRREGDVLGTTQAGRTTSLKQLSLLEHRQTIEEARADAAELVSADASLRTWPGLVDMLGEVIAEQDQTFLEMG